MILDPQRKSMVLENGSTIQVGDRLHVISPWSREARIYEVIFIEPENYSGQLPLKGMDESGDEVWFGPDQIVYAQDVI